MDAQPSPPPTSVEQELKQLRQKLAELEAERRAIESRCLTLKALLERQKQEVTHRRGKSRLSPAEKIALFRSLFLYPRRFENKKSGKCGYQPVCANEWVPMFCNKPRTICSKCAYRRWLPLTDAMINLHLRGCDQRGRDVALGETV